MIYQDGERYGIACKLWTDLTIKYVTKIPLAFSAQFVWS